MTLTPKVKQQFLKAMMLRNKTTSKLKTANTRKTSEKGPNLRNQ